MSHITVIACIQMEKVVEVDVYLRNDITGVKEGFLELDGNLHSCTFVQDNIFHRIDSGRKRELYFRGLDE